MAVMFTAKSEEGENKLSQGGYQTSRATPERNTPKTAHTVCILCMCAYGLLLPTPLHQISLISSPLPLSSHTESDQQNFGYSRSSPYQTNQIEFFHQLLNLLRRHNNNNVVLCYISLWHWWWVWLQPAAARKIGRLHYIITINHPVKLVVEVKKVFKTQKVWALQAVFCFLSVHRCSQKRFFFHSVFVFVTSPLISPLAFYFYKYKSFLHEHKLDLYYLFTKVD